MGLRRSRGKRLKHAIGSARTPQHLSRPRESLRQARRLPDTRHGNPSNMFGAARASGISPPQPAGAGLLNMTTGPGFPSTDASARLMPTRFASPPSVIARQSVPCAKRIGSGRGTASAIADVARHTRPIWRCRSMWIRSWSCSGSLRRIQTRRRRHQVAPDFSRDAEKRFSGLRSFR